MKKDKRKFFGAFIKNPRQTGSIIQSSSYLVKKLTDPVDYKKAKILIEFGAGTGVVTEKILEKMSKDAKLLCFELDNELARRLKEKVKDDRVKFIQDSAEKLGDYLKKYEIKDVDYIISGLPIGSLPKTVGKKILGQILKHLKRGGKYIQFQYSLLSLKDYKKSFRNVELDFTPFNIPPAFIYICTK